MQFTGIIKNKARVLPKVVYLDVVSKVDGPHKQWVLFKSKHTMQDINMIANASPGSSIIVDGKDNINEQTNLPQVVINKLINIIPQDAEMPDTSSASALDDLFVDGFAVDANAAAKNKVREVVASYALKTSKQEAIVLLCQMITGLTVGK